jgi:hypothetical protein
VIAIEVGKGRTVLQPIYTPDNVEASGRSALGRILVLIAVLMLVLVAFPTEAGTTDLGTALRVEWNPDSLTLRPGAEGEFDLVVENVADVSLRIALMFTAVKTPGGCRATVSPTFFELEPDAIQIIQVSVRTNAEYLQERGISDCRIYVEWGINLTQDPQWHAVCGTADGHGDLTLPLRDDFSSITLRIVAIIAFTVAFLCAVAYLVRRRPRSLRSPIGPNAK